MAKNCGIPEYHAGLLMAHWSHLLAGAIRGAHTIQPKRLHTQHILWLNAISTAQCRMEVMQVVMARSCSNVSE